MAEGLNKVLLIGNLGRDPEMRPRIEAARKLAAYFLIDRADAKSALPYAKLTQDKTLTKLVTDAGLEIGKVTGERLYAVGELYFRLRSMATTDPGRTHAAKKSHLYLTRFLAGHKQQDLRATQVQLMIKSLNVETPK